MSRLFMRAKVLSIFTFNISCPFLFSKSGHPWRKASDVISARVTFSIEVPLKTVTLAEETAYASLTKSAPNLRIHVLRSHRRMNLR